MKNKKLFFYIATLLLFTPLNALPANLSLLEVNRSFHLLKREITEIHLSNFLNPQNYSPEEEAVIVLTKKAALSELINLSFKDLPKEFIMSALLRSGTHFIKTSGTPLEFLEKEFLTRSVEQLTSWLLQNNLNIAGGEINLSYENLEKERVSEKFLYSVIRENRNYVSITIYSTKNISPPLSVPGPVISNSLWRMNDFKKEKLDPFSITFSGEIKETSQGAFYLKENPEIEITFYQETFSVSLPPSSFLEKLRSTANNFFGNIFSFFLSEENILKSSIAAMLNNKKDKEVSSPQTVVVLDDNEVKKTEEKKKIEDVEEETPKTEERTTAHDKKEKSIPSKIEINTALGEDLERLAGIGPTYAERIIENRPYCTLDDLLKVPGIGEVTLQKIKDQGLAYVVPLPDCLGEEKRTREEQIKILLEAKKTLESIRKVVEERRRNTEEEFDDNEEEKEILIKVEVNSDSLENLALITGIGPSLAERIIENRPYCVLDDLLKVPGIGEVTLQKIKDQGLAYVEPDESCNRNDNEGSSPSPTPPKEEDEKQEEKEEDQNSIEINSASFEELQIITGIGPSLAERIIENRPYCMLDDLLKVPGIGEVTLQKIKDQGLAYVEPDESCAEEDEENDSEEDEDEEEENDSEEDEEEKDDDENEEDEDEEENNIVVNNAEIYYHISLIKQIINSSGENNKVLDKSIVSRAELLIEKILEKYFTTSLTKPSFIN
jgi:competence ComEA-like helix-hairpin-helix protein